jgi:hypothetical protein
MTILDCRPNPFPTFPNGRIRQPDNSKRWDASTGIKINLYFNQNAVYTDDSASISDCKHEILTMSITYHG